MTRDIHDMACVAAFWERLKEALTFQMRGSDLMCSLSDLEFAEGEEKGRTSRRASGLACESTTRGCLLRRRPLLFRSCRFILRLVPAFPAPTAFYDIYTVVLKLDYPGELRIPVDIPEP